MISITYSFIATRTGDFYFTACETPICASCVGIPTFNVQTNNPPYRSSVNAASCSLYTFVANSVNTRVAIEQCLVYRPVPGGQPSSFTHSLQYQPGEVAFICSATAPRLENGSWTNFGTFSQPGSPCDCGEPFRTTTSTSTTTTLAPFTQSWRALRLCGCIERPFTSTISNINIAQYNPFPGRVYRGADNHCYRLINTVPYQAPRYPTFTSGFQIDCNTCAQSISGINPCTTTTTSTTTSFPQGPPTINNCNCGQFTCNAYEVEGNPGDSLRWTDCTQSIQNGGFPNFGFYYFYDSEAIAFCACSNSVEVISGNPTINGVSTTPGQIPTPGNTCYQRTSDCSVCRSFAIELGEEIRSNDTRPVMVEYVSCYEPEGGWQAPGYYLTKTMWPVTAGITFSGLPVPSPWWAPIPQSGQVPFGRKTHIYSICGCGNTDKPIGDPSFTSPTISYWDQGLSSWQNSPLTTDETQLSGGLKHYIRSGCSGGTCSCYNYTICPTSTTTIAPCPNCRPTVIGASGPNFTNIAYEGCDSLGNSIKYDYLYVGNTSSICACERCRSVRARPLGAVGTFTPLNYVHCCDPVFNNSGIPLPSYHSSVLNLMVRNCRTFQLQSAIDGNNRRYRYIDCNDSKIKEIFVQGFPLGSDVFVCASTASRADTPGVSGIIDNGTCGTASAEICISRDYYGSTVFPDDPTIGSIGLGIFTFSNIGSCSCIVSDNRYQPYQSRGFNTPVSMPDPLIDSLSITFSTATCSDKTAVPSNNNFTPTAPPCCNCKTYKVTLTSGDIVNYRPCETNRDPATILGLSLPQITMNRSTQSTGSFSVRVVATGFYGVGSFSIVFNHDKLVFYTASVTQNSLITDGRLAVSGSFSRFAWQNTSGANFGSAEILNFTFAAISSARLDFMTSSTATFYQATNIADFTGQTLSESVNDGWIKFPGINLPGSNKNSIPPNFPTFP